MNTTKPKKETRTEVEIALFVPARALEHHNNPEFSTLRDKIIFALQRWYQKQDFSADIEVGYGPLPFISLRQWEFKNDPLGYDIKASVLV